MAALKIKFLRILLFLSIAFIQHQQQSARAHNFQHRIRDYDEDQDALNQEEEDKDAAEDCNGRRIYIRRLPSRFNFDLLSRCADYPIHVNFCPYIANHGLGPKTHNRSHSWFRTDPQMLELLFQRRILEYPCLTADPAKADAVFLPYYAGLDALRYLYRPAGNASASHGLDLYRFIRDDRPQIWDRHGGRDHFLVMARPAWDFSKPLSSGPPVWGTSFLELPEFFPVTALTLESRTWPWQEQAVPYPTSFHPPSAARMEAWLARVRRARRTKLMALVAVGRPNASPTIDNTIRRECSRSGGLCEVVNCTKGACEHDPLRHMRPMLRASFCLQPPGDTPTRRATFDGIVAGCIPVFFEEQSAKAQFGWHLRPAEYGEFSVFIPKEEVVARRVRVAEVLKRIPKARVRKMRERVVGLVPRVTYRRHACSPDLRSTEDAFDLSVQGTIRRIKSRLAEPLLS